MGEGLGNFIVTGAAGGVGSAAVRQLAARGANVLAVDRDKPEDGTSPRPGEVVFCQADVGVEDDVRSYMEQIVGMWGELSGVYNVAGVEGEFAKSGEASIANYDNVMQVNARSVFLNMLFGIPLLVRRGGGRIVNTGSHLAWHGAATLGAYCASKHAVMGLTRAAALEYAKDGIRVNCVCPSAIDTAMSQRVAQAIDPVDHQAGMQVLIDQAPNARLATADEVASVGVWLLLDAPAHINGILVPVDGGQAAA
jgi:NAD(P)-dependent dehydrogenase (short-subunit alcohol dehydrogenase family)